jgi:hypothetical protein
MHHKACLSPPHRVTEAAKYAIHHKPNRFGRRAQRPRREISQRRRVPFAQQQQKGAQA